MKIYRITLIVVVLTWFTFLFFTENPLVGTFRLSSSGPLLSETGGTGYALVYINNHKVTKTFALEDVQFGLSGINAASYFIEFGILLGILLGFLSGDLSRGMFIVNQASKDAIQEGNDLKFDAQLKILNAKSMMWAANTLCADYPQLKKKLAETQKALFVTREDRSDLVTAYNNRGQKLESVEKELVKAKGKIRRLEGQMERGKGQKQLTYAPDQHRL